MDHLRNRVLSGDGAASVAFKYLVHCKIVVLTGRTANVLSVRVVKLHGPALNVSKIVTMEPFLRTMASSNHPVPRQRR
jgi:hypothetical protein